MVYAHKMAQYSTVQYSKVLKMPIIGVVVAKRKSIVNSYASTERIALLLNKTHERLGIKLFL